MAYGEGDRLGTARRVADDIGGAAAPVRPVAGRLRGRRPLWTYAHVPSGSTEDVTETVIRLFENAAPGFRDLVLASRCVTAAQMPEHNANYVGGDIIVGGATLFAAMVGPTLRWNPWTTPIPKAYLSSSATPPGTGVHGMCGYYAARTVLKREFGLPLPSLAP